MQHHATPNLTGTHEEIPSEQLLRTVRAAFVMRGTSLSRWCETHGVTRQYAEKCLRFATNGRAARALRGRICRAAGVPWA